MNLFDFVNSTSSKMSVSQITFNMIVTLMVALFIYWVYKKTYEGVMYSKNFNVTIVLITMVTAMVMMVIGSNLALSLGMVGALSIIRFRSAIKDPKDIGFLFWGIAVGLSAGTGSYIIAVVSSIMIAIVLFLFDNISYKNDAYLLVVKGNEIDEEELNRIIKKNISKFKLRMKNNTLDSIEIIYEIRIDENKDTELIEQINDLKGVLMINIVSHNGEIAG